MKMKLVVDAMSGDLGSQPVLKAVTMFREAYPDIDLVVVGKTQEMDSLKQDDKIELIDAQDIMEMTDSVLAIRRKKESSLFKAVQLIKNDEADAMISCGNTGAYYACCMLFVHRIEGVEKSCLMANLPTMDGKGVLMLDVGANVENTAEQLKQFAIMGDVYARLIAGKENPRITLLNIGTEEKKGTDVRKETYQLLKNSNLNFIGNIEGRDILTGSSDVIVTDGFAGNIALKSLEGTAKTLMKMLMESLMSSTVSKVGALLAKGKLKEQATQFDYKSGGGAILIGLALPIINAHGASDEVAFFHAMELAKDKVAQDVVAKMKDGLSNEIN